MKGGIPMYGYGYGYPGYGCDGFGGNCIWIIIVVLIIFFVLFWGNGNNCNHCPNNNCGC